MGKRALILGAVLVSAPLGPGVAWSAPASRLSVTVARLSPPPPSVLAGATLRVDETSRNVGRTRSPRTLTIYLASRDRRASGGDVLLGSQVVRALRPGASARSVRRLMVAPSTRAATYWLIACGGVRLVRGHYYGGGSCRVARRRFEILPASPTIAAGPRIAGRPTDGQTLSANLGSWRGVTPISYADRWRRCNVAGVGCEDIAGATAPTYQVTPADVGATIRVAVTASNARGAAAADSPQTPRVTAVAPANTAPPTVAGTAVVGETLSGDAGLWSGTAPIDYAYQWQRCDSSASVCNDIPGATADTYTLTGADAGPMLRMVVTAANPAGPVTAASSAVATGLWANPVFGDNPTPDPFVLDNGGSHSDYWEFGTGGLFPILHSNDLINWSSAGTAFTTRPDWVPQTGDWHPWGPSVLRVAKPCAGAASGPCFLMYYTGLSVAYGGNCVAVATALSPDGPYTDQGPLQQLGGTGEPVGCGDGSGAPGQGNIDPAPFIDTDGTAYLYTSTDRNGSQLQPTISVIPLSTDLLHASGARVRLFSGNAGTWEGAGTPTPTVEGPSMEKRGSTYYLFYSGGSWTGAYGMGYRMASSPTGPFAPSPGNQLLSEAAGVRSPGGGATVTTGPHGGTWMVYHGRDSVYSNPRTLRIDPFSWQAAATPGLPDVPVISGPTSAPQTIAP